MAFEAGSVFVKLGALLDKSGFDQYDRALGGARANAARGATAKLEADTAKAEEKIARLTAAIDKVKKEKAEAKTDVEIAGSVAKLKILQHELDKTANQTATAKLKGDFKDLGLAAGDLQSVLGGGSGSGGNQKGLIGTIGGLAGQIPMLAKAAVAAAPAIAGLAGGITALLGSAGAATLGAGAAGVAGVGALGVGLGSIISVAKPAASEIKKVSAAYMQYDKVLKQYGARDPATIQAQKQLNAVVGVEGGNAVLQLVKQTRVFGDEWKKQTTAARADMYGILLDGIHTVQHDMGTFSGVVDHVWAGLRDNLDRTFKMMRGQEFQGDVKAMGDTFVAGMKPMFNALDHLILFFGRVAKESSPYLLELIGGFDRWAAHLDNSNRNVDELDHKLNGLFGQFRSWLNLTEALGHLLVTIFKGGADSGQNLVDTLTHLLNKWNAFLQTPRGQSDMRKFFQDSVNLVKVLFQFLGQGSGAIFKIASNLMPAWIAAAKILNATIVPVLEGISKLIGEHKSLTDVAGGFIAIAAAINLSKKALGLLMIDLRKLRKVNTEEAVAQDVAQAAGGGGVGGGVGGGGKLLNLLRRVGGAGTSGSLPGAVEKAGSTRLATLLSTLSLGAGNARAGIGGALTRFGGALNEAPLIGGIMGKITGGLSGAGGLTSGRLGTALLGQGALGGLARLSIWGDIGIGITKGIFTGFHKGVSNGALEALHSITLGLTPAPKDFDKVDKQIGDDIDRINQLANQAAQAKKLGINMDVNFKTDKANEALQGFLDQLDRTRKGAATSIAGARSDLELNMKLIAHTMDINSAQGRDAVSANYKAVAAEIKNAMHAGTISTKQGTDEINKLLRQALAVYGIKGQQASYYLAGKDTLTGKPLNVPGAAGGGNHAVGGWIGSRGERGADNIPMNVGGRPIVVGRGEALLAGPDPAIVNSHQQDYVEVGLATSKAMGFQPYGSLDELFAGVNRRHSEFAAGGKVMSQVSLQGVNPWVINAAKQVELQFPGLTITSGTGGQHAQDSLHYRGDAVDMASGDSSLMNRAAAWIKNSGMARRLAEGIHNPNLSIKNGKPVASSYWGSTVWDEHLNHIHIGLLNAIGQFSGAGLQRIPRLTVKGPDSALRTLLQGGLDSARRGANSVIARAAQDSGGAEGPAGASGKPAPPGQVRNWLTTALRATNHYTSAGLNALFGRTMQESGGNPDAQNNWDSNAAAGDPSRGLLQTTSATFNAYKLPGHGNIWNPVDNAIAAIRYMFSRYGHIVGPSASGYELGGRVHDRVAASAAATSGSNRPRKKARFNPKSYVKKQLKALGHKPSKPVKPPKGIPGLNSASVNVLNSLDTEIAKGEKDYTYFSSLFGQTNEQATVTLNDADSWLASGFAKFDPTKDPTTFTWQSGDEMANEAGGVFGKYFDADGNIIGGDFIGGIKQHVDELNKLIGIRQGILSGDEQQEDLANNGLGEVQAWIKQAQEQLKNFRAQLTKWLRKLRDDNEDVTSVQQENQGLGIQYQKTVNEIAKKYADRRNKITNAQANQTFSKKTMTSAMVGDLTQEEDAALAGIRTGSGSPLLKSQRSAEIRKSFKDRRAALQQKSAQATFGESMQKKDALWLLSQGESQEKFNARIYNQEVKNARSGMLKQLRGDVGTDKGNRDRFKSAISTLLGRMHDVDPTGYAGMDFSFDNFSDVLGGKISVPSSAMDPNSTKGGLLQRLADLPDTIRTERDITLQPLLDERDQWLKASDSHPRTPGQTSGLQGLAAGAAAQLASFQSSRANLFSNFGSNFVPAQLLSGDYFNDPTTQAAGFRYFGATSGAASGAAGIDPAGGSGPTQQFVQNNYYDSGPEDPHIHAQTSRMEFTTAFG